MGARLAVVIVVGGLLGGCSGGGGQQESAAAVDLAFVGVQVFDGERVISEATVLVGDGKVLTVDAGVQVPEGTAEVVEGRGRTLLPGLIDGHTHVQMRGALEQTLRFGVTTSLDMFTMEDFAGEMRREQAAGGAEDRADLFSAGYPATARGGHGTQYGVPIPTLASPADAEGFVAGRARAGADYIKVVIESGYDQSLPTLDGPTVEAVVDAAHRRNLLVVTHIHSLEAARTAVAAGTDGLAHVMHDVPPDDQFIELAVEAGVFVVPTMPVIESVAGTSPPASYLAEPCLSDGARSGLSTPFDGIEGVGLEAAVESVRRLHRAGVPIVAGSDAPNPGTAHGLSLHRELELMVDSGLTPTEALAASTSGPAAIFGLDDRGRLAEGRRADLLLVDGDPTEDITNTRAIVGVWKAGVPADRSTCLR